MANTSATWDIVDLTARTEQGVDPDFEYLRVAASRAQHAASRYLEQTLSLESAQPAQGPRGTLSSRDDIDLVGGTSGPAKDATRAFFAPEIRSSKSEYKQKSHNDVFQGVSSYAGYTSPPQPQSNAADSGLGESVSETEDPSSPINSLFPYIETTNVSIFRKEKCLSAQHFQKPSLLQDAAGELQTPKQDQPLPNVTIPRKAGISRTSKQGTPPGLSESDPMTSGNPRRSQENSSVTFHAVNDELHSYQTQHDRLTPRRKKGRPRKSSPGIHPYQKRKRDSFDNVPALRARRSPIKERNKVLSQTKSRYSEPPTSERMYKVSRRSLPRLGFSGDPDALEANDLTSRVYQPPSEFPLSRNRAEDSLWRVSSLADKVVNRQRLSRESIEDALFLSYGDDRTLAKTLKEAIYPLLEAAIEGRKGLLPEDKLVSIAKTVARKVADHDFRMFLKESDYHLDRRQKKMIKRSVEDTFGQEALFVYNKHQPNSRSNLFEGEERNSKASVTTHCYSKRERASYGDKNLEHLHISTSAPTSYDMSLLGPGELCPSLALVAPSVGLHNESPVSSKSSHTDLGKRVKKVRCMPRHTAPSREIFSQVRGAKIKDLDPCMYETERVRRASPPRLHDVEWAPLVEGSAVRASKAKVDHGIPKVFTTVNTDSVVESYVGNPTLNEWEHDSLAKGAVDHISSRYSTTDDSRSSSSESQSSTISKIFDGNAFGYGPFQHRSGKEVPNKACIRQPQALNHWPKPNTTQSHPASSYSMALSPVLMGREPGAEFDVSHSARQRPNLRHVNTPLELVKSRTDQGHASNADELIAASKHYSSDVPREQGDMQKSGRKQSWNSRYVHEDEREGEVVDLRTFTVPRVVLSPGQASNLRNSIDESTRNTEQPLTPNQSFRPEDHRSRLNISCSHGPNRSSNHVPRSLKQRTSSRSRALHKSTHAISSQTVRRVHTKTSSDANSTNSSTPLSLGTAIDMGQISSLIEKQKGRMEESASDSSSTPPIALPTAHDPLLAQLAARLALQDLRIPRPYVESNINAFTVADSHGQVKHVDFSYEESKVFLDSISIAKQQEGPFHLPVLANIRNTHPGRDDENILSYFTDLQNQTAAAKPGFKRVEHTVVDPARRSHRSISSTLRRRELGLNTGNEAKSIISKILHPWRSWRGASGDVVACAWGPDSTTYAAGAAAHVNPEDQQYNRSCNLLLGDLITNKLQELPDHRVARPHTANIPTAPHDTEELYNVLDPMLYKTVTSVQFSKDGSKLYTASHDSTVKVWDVRQRTCLKTLRHKDHVTSLEVCKIHEGVFATASKIIDNAIRVYCPNSEGSYEDSGYHGWAGFSSFRAQQKRSWEIYPECIRWGLSSSTNHLLLVGFQQWQGHQGPLPAREGDLCLFDLNSLQAIKVSPSSQSVHSVAWHPVLNLFATGGSARKGRLTNRQTTRTVVRSWDLRNPNSYAMEYECTAVDIQDITFHPQNSSYITASCTDGNIYVWDFRKPNRLLHRLQHGMPLMDLDEDFCREEQDAGVMLTTWDEHGNSLFTGSSDGIIKEWDVRRAPENALVRDVAQLGAGVQNGAFSADFSNLLVGDAAGAVHVLSSAPIGPEAIDEDDDDEVFIKKTMPIEFVPAAEQAEDDENPGVEGIMASYERLDSDELIVDEQYGAGQGPHYQGPYARWARTTIGHGVGLGQLTPQVEASRQAAEKEKTRVVQERRAMLEEDKLYRRLQEEGGVREHFWWCGCIRCCGE